MDPLNPAQEIPPPGPQCKSCTSADIETGYLMPLCASCRDRLARRPIPAWVYAVGAAVLLVVVYSFIAFPKSLRTGIIEARARKAQAAGNYALAESDYAIVANGYPDDVVDMGRLAVCAYKSGDFRTAASALAALNGKDVDSDEANELNIVQSGLEAKESQSQPSSGAPGASPASDAQNGGP